jgi:hypothetical protein
MEKPEEISFTRHLKQTSSSRHHPLLSHLILKTGIITPFIDEENESQRMVLGALF